MIPGRELKRRFGRDDVCITVSSVKLDLNKKDMKRFIEFWKGQRGVDRIIIADLWDRMGGKDAVGIGRFDKLHRKDVWLAPCLQIWAGVNIYFDGRVAPCCDDADRRQLIIGANNF